jgi:hypothetical protein
MGDEVVYQGGTAIRGVEQRADGERKGDDEDQKHHEHHDRDREPAASSDCSLQSEQGRPCGNRNRRGPDHPAQKGQQRPQAAHEQNGYDENEQHYAGDIG